MSTVAASAVMISSHGTGTSGALVLELQSTVAEIQSELADQQSEIDALQNAIVPESIEGGTF